MAPPAKRRKTAHRAERYLCTSCSANRLAKLFPDYNPTPDCDHTINTCSGCLKTWVNIQVDSGHLITSGEDDGVFGIQCPECDNIMHNVNIEAAASKKTYKKFAQLERRHIAENIPGWRWCLAPGCDLGKVHEKLAMPEKAKSKSRKGGKQEPQPEVFDICICECGAKACVTCDRPWHEGELCADYQARVKNRTEEEDKTLQQIQQHTKPCPGCSKRIEKNGGCPMMFCTQCHIYFCWICTKQILQGVCGCNRHVRQAVPPS